MLNADVIVIGSGIAGASAAAQLADTHRVLLLEREEQPGYHATGRSAALYSEIYGNAAIRALTRASRDFLRDPPAGFASGPLLHPRGSLFIATAPQLGELQAFAALPDVAPATRPMSPSAACALCPVLRPDHLAGALLEPDSSDIEVHALHQAFLRLLRGRGGVLQANSPVTGLTRRGSHWLVTAGEALYGAPVIVNAAGAWADEIAVLAGARPLGLQPLRRTAVLVDPPAGALVNAWPMVIDIEERFYFKPDAALLLISPADETPAAAGDAQPEEWDVAMAVDRVESATSLHIDRLRHRWAGLRTFAPDRSPVVGFDDDVPGFFWLAGQGGYGIQTAPAMARVAAALLRHHALPDDLQRLGVRAADLAPARFAHEGSVPVGPGGRPCSGIS